MKNKVIQIILRPMVLIRNMRAAWLKLSLLIEGGPAVYWRKCLVLRSVRTSEGHSWGVLEHRRLPYGEVEYRKAPEETFEEWSNRQW